MMKKWVKVCLIVLCVLLGVEVLLYGLCIRINPLAVDRMVLCSYDDQEQKFYQVELTREEISKLAMLYNYGFAIPESNEQIGCPIDCDRLEVYYGDNSLMSIHGVWDEKLITAGGFLVSDTQLRGYIQQLLAKYELPAW